MGMVRENGIEEFKVCPTNTLNWESLT